jgi:hypothetical protein
VFLVAILFIALRHNRQMLSQSLAPPSQQYLERQQIHQTRAASLSLQHRILGYLRLLTAVGFLVAAWFSFTHQFDFLWLPATLLILFTASTVIHSQTLQSLAHAQRGIAFYEHGLARIDDRWQGLQPRSVDPVLAGASLYAQDLDITGAAGLFELLCTARTRMGESTLLQWLLHPATASEVRERQTAITELRNQLDLREAMAIAGSSVKIGVHPEELQAWADAPNPLPDAWMQWAARILCALAIVTSVYAIKRGVLPFVVVVLVEAGFALFLKRRIAAVFGDTEQTLQNLELLSVLLQCIEGATFHSPLLLNLKAKLSSHHLQGSKAIARLGVLVERKQALNNPFLRALNIPLMYSVQLAFAIQHWRNRHGRAIRAWLEAVGEMEALLSLAAFSYEHPDDTFPTLIDGPASFEAEGLGHPLIAASKCVRNDIHVGGKCRVLMISGSNMSGKSTLMRSIGTNTVLAMCGSVVRAERLQLTPLQTAASLVVNDSLQTGQSRFYAEIDRLQRICSVAERPGPSVLFLLDELLQGTNSLDRLKGAEGVTHALVEAGAIGLIATHDLSLTAMDSSGSLGLENAHFQEEIVDGRMKFDFKLRKGIVTRSNGVAWMRLIGLKV